MAYRNAQDIRASAIAFIDAREDGMRTEAGEPIVDLVDAVANEQGKLYVVADYLTRINSVAGWRSVIDDAVFKVQLANAFDVSATTLTVAIALALGVPDDLPSDIEAIIFKDLNDFADSLGETRKPATNATSNERLFLSSSSPFTLLRGALVKVGSSTVVEYNTTDDVIGVIPAFDPIQNSLFVDVGIRAVAAGTGGNQIVGAIRVISPPIQGVVRALNTVPAEGGLPRESNSQLLDRLVASQVGTDIGTVEGLTSFVANFKDVFDVALVGPGDPLMTRSPAGAIDIYIIGSQLSTVTVVTQIINLGEELVFQYQPLRNFNSAKNLATTDTYQDGNGLTLILDTGDFARSALANDKLIWDPTVGPTPGQDVAVNFTYNALMRSIQMELDDNPARNIPAADILVKEGHQLSVVLSMRVVAVPGFEQLEVQQAVQSNLQLYFSQLKLGELVEFSTAIVFAQTATIDGVPVVDRVDEFLMGVLGNELTNDNITALRNEYGRLFNIQFLTTEA